MSSAICFNLDQSKIFLSGRGLIMIKFLSQRACFLTMPRKKKAVENTIL